MEKTKNPSGMYKIYELKEEMNTSIANIKKVIDSQEDLLKLLETQEGKFNELKEALANDIRQYKEQANVLAYRIILADSLIQVYERKDKDSEKVDAIVTTMLFMLGVIKKEEIKEAESTKTSEA